MKNKKKKIKNLKINYSALKINIKRIQKQNIKIQLKSGFLPCVVKENNLILLDKNEQSKIGILSIILSFFAGVINGIFGGGAGMLIVPILEEIMHLKTKSAHATAVLIVLPLCLVSVIAYLITDKFDFTNGFWVLIGVVLGGIVGAFLLKKLDAKIIRFIFAFLVIFAGGKLFFDNLMKMI